MWNELRLLSRPHASASVTVLLALLLCRCRREDTSPVTAVVEAFMELTREQQEQAFSEIQEAFYNATLAA